MAFIDISVSLDGYVAGPNQSLDEPLGAGGERLHDWVLATRAWREAHGQEGGDDNVDGQMVEETRGRTGATIMGRRMYSSGSGPWEDDPKANGWWGDEPPFGHPVFVLTHHAREPLTLGATTFTFVTDGIEAAHAQAEAAAGEREVIIAGGADVARQCLKAGLIDDIQLHIAPILLGAGARLLDDHVGRLERTRVIESPSGTTHVKFTVPR